MSGDIAEHTRELARELLDDLELSRLRPEQLLLKASRLARLVENPEIGAWIDCELRGYKSKDPISQKYMGIVGRWTDRAEGKGYWIPLAQIEGHILASQTELSQLQIPNVHFAPSSANPHENVVGLWGQHVTTATQPVTNVLQVMGHLSGTIAKMSGIRSRVLSVLHDFVSKTYYTLEFSGMAETIFQEYKKMIDLVLAERSSDILSKVPAIYARLADGGQEETSQALNTCRRIINSFADAQYPPREPGSMEDGVLVGPDNYLNRINRYVDMNTASASRRQRLRRTLREVHERVSAGVHADVTLGEAKALFLSTYLILGEISLLGKESLRSESRKEPDEGLESQADGLEEADTTG